MRFTITIQRQPDSWQVAVSGPDNIELVQRRSLPAAAAAGEYTFPLPPPDEAADFPLFAPHARFCTERDSSQILNVYLEIARRDSSAQKSAEFGCYLFACLLGDRVWQQICDRAGDQPIDLVLRWPASDLDLNRLPWEMLTYCHNGRALKLAADRHRAVTITRVVDGALDNASARAAAQAISLPLRVLVIVGAELNDPEIQAGAEWFGLLRHLKARKQEICVNERLLLRASVEQIEAQLRSFRPAVVHFICHGGYQPGQGCFLKLYTDSQPFSQPQPFNADSLFELLQSAASDNWCPPIVVLSACYSGGAPRAKPLAAELVHRGIPMVVGMGQRISDWACRLFTRRFYEALLNGESVVDAVAEGRRAGLRSSGNPDATADWAWPCLFLSEHATPQIARDGVDLALKTEELASSYCETAKPLVFCGRFQAFDACRALLDAGLRGVPRALVVEVSAPRYEDQLELQYGKTRLLEELTAQAVREGHIPVWMAFHDQYGQFGAPEPPKNAAALVLALLRAVWDTRKRISKYLYPDLNVTPDKHLLHLLDPHGALCTSISADMHDYRHHLNEIESRIQENQLTNKQKHITAEDLREELAHELAELAEELCEKRALHKHTRSGTPQVLLLIDDLHRCANASLVLEALLSANGLDRVGLRPFPVKVVITYTSNAGSQAYVATLRTIQEFVERRRNIRRLVLDPFEPGTEAHIAYRQFLLSRETPLTISQHEEIVLAQLNSEIRGIPSLFSSDRVDATIKTCQSLKVLEPANDEEMLQALRAGTL